MKKNVHYLHVSSKLWISNICNVFRSLFSAHQAFIDQKYNKNSNIVKNDYNLK